MKSLQVACTIDSAGERKRYSDLQVLHSPAGWYIGTIYNAIEGWQEPGSRDSDYFKTKEIAQECLTKLEQLAERLVQEGEESESAIPYWENWLQSKGYDPRQVGYRFTP